MNVIRTESLAEALPKEIARVTEIMAEYKAIPAGWIAAEMMRVDIQYAIAATMEGDVVQMLISYQKLKEYEL